MRESAAPPGLAAAHSERALLRLAHLEKKAPLLLRLPS
jgi:hypothetical protein